MAVPMPSVVVLVMCRVILGEPDHNSQYTHYRASEWDMTNGVMHCKREEVQLYDPAVDQGAVEQPFSQFHCNRAGMTMGTNFDMDRLVKETKFPPGAKGWRYRRHACPVPIVDTQTGEIIAWKIPECGTENGTVTCEKDTVI